MAAKSTVGIKNLVGSGRKFGRFEEGSSLGAFIMAGGETFILIDLNYSRPEIELSSAVRTST